MRMKSIWPLIFDLGRAQPPPLLIQSFLSWDFGPQVKDFHLLCPTGPTEEGLTTHSNILVQQYVNHELPDVEAGFRKGRGTRDQIANIRWIIEKEKSSRKTSISALLTMPKPLTV